MAVVVRATRDAALAALSATNDLPVFDCLDGDPVVTLAGLRGRVPESVGVRLVVGQEYPAALAARDVATLAHLVGLTTVVVSGQYPDDAADLIRRFLTDQAVTWTNSAGSLRDAYNRPAPPRDIVVLTDAKLAD